MSARFAASEIRAVLGLPPEGPAARFTSVATDSRTLEPGALFVALRGDRFDGADFVGEAVRKGAVGVVLPRGREREEIGVPVFPAADTTRALGALATAWRRRCDARVIGVTGSSGKTTVKEMLARALEPALPVHASPGNFNNRIGVPLAILGAPAEARVWVLELGTSEPGEIELLTAIAEPDDAVVTTVGAAHLEGLGDEAGVLREKLALVRGARDTGAVTVGEVPPALPRATRDLRPDARVAGLGAEADFAPDAWRIGAAECEFRRADRLFRVAAGGEHHLRDALIAVAAAEAAGAPPDRIAEGLTRFRPMGMRGSLRRVGELTIVADCYNANPESFEAAIRWCADGFPGRRKVAAVGSMLELGERSPAAHRAVAAALLDAGFTLVVAAGEFAAAFEGMATPPGAEVRRVPDAAAAAEVLPPLLHGDEVVLVKGSRGARMEAVVEALAAEARDAAAAGGNR